jgi:hypothetical protein
MVLMAAPVGRKGPKIELRVCVHILEKKSVSKYDQHIVKKFNL